MSFEKGVSSFIQNLADSMDINLHVNSKVEKIEKKEDNYLLHVNNKTENFDRVILSTPAYESAKMIENFDKNLAEQLKEIEYSPISVVGFGYNNFKHDLKGFGLLTTTSANKEILGVLWDSSIFHDRAPEGKKSVRVMIGGQRNPELGLKSEEELIEIAKRGIKETMGVSDEPDVSFVKRYEKGIPNYKVGHLSSMDGLMSDLKAHKGLYLSSNAYFGVGLNDCISNARKVSEEVLAEL